MFSVFSYLDDLHRVGPAGFAYRLANSHDNQIAVAHDAALEQFVFSMIQDNLGIVRSAAELNGIDAAKQRHFTAGILLGAQREDRYVGASARHQQYRSTALRERGNGPNFQSPAVNMVARAIASSIVSGRPP